MDLSVYVRADLAQQGSGAGTIAWRHGSPPDKISDSIAICTINHTLAVYHPYNLRFPSTFSECHSLRALNHRYPS